MSYQYLRTFTFILNKTQSSSMVNHRLVCFCQKDAFFTSDFCPYSVCMWTWPFDFEN